MVYRVNVVAVEFFYTVVVHITAAVRCLRATSAFDAFLLLLFVMLLFLFLLMFWRLFIALL